MLLRLPSLLLLRAQHVRGVSSSPLPDASASSSHRSALFHEEQERQLSLVARIEKINVEYVGVPENANLLLNKELSTPHNVAQRQS